MVTKSNLEVRAMAKVSKKTELEDAFYLHWQLMFPDLPMPVRQHPILNPKTNRHWKLDFAWPQEKLAVELQGGSFIRGGHNTAKGQHSDYERHNTLTKMGWRTLFFNTIGCKDMAAAVEFVAEVLTDAKEVL